jgi:hypothetical protein
LIDCSDGLLEEEEEEEETRLRMGDPLGLCMSSSSPHSAFERGAFKEGVDEEEEEDNGGFGTTNNGLLEFRDRVYFTCPRIETILPKHGWSDTIDLLLEFTHHTCPIDTVCPITKAL